MHIIVEKRPVSETAMLMSIHAPLIAEKALPGQFAAVWLKGYSCPVPLAVAGYDRKAGEITVIFHRAGPAAEQLAAREVGDALPGFSGPFGKACEPQAGKKVIAVCGGMGCAALYLPIKELCAAGAQVDVIAGFRSRGSVMLEEVLRAHASDLLISTEDGSYGRQGPAALLLHERLQQESYQLAIAAGPPAMLQAVCELTEKFRLPTRTTLHPAVTDIQGRCTCCRITAGGVLQCPCTDGPDFDGHKISWRAPAQDAGLSGKTDSPCLLLSV